MIYGFKLILPPTIFLNEITVQEESKSAKHLKKIKLCSVPPTHASFPSTIYTSTHSVGSPAPLSPSHFQWAIARSMFELLLNILGVATQDWYTLRYTAPKFKKCHPYLCYYNPLVVLIKKIALIVKTMNEAASSFFCYVKNCKT